MIRTPRFFILGFCISFLPLAVCSQQTNKILPLTLHEALKLAKSNYPLLKKRLAEKAVTENETEAMLAGYLPQAGIQAQALLGTSNQVHGAVQGYDGLLMGLTGSIKPNGFDWKPAWTGLTSTVVDWRAFTFGRKSADKNLASSRTELAGRLFEQELFEHQVKVADAYLLALNAQKYAELQQRNVKRTEDIVAVTRANASSGLKAGIDSSIAVAEATRALLQWMDSQMQVKKYAVLLSELIGEAGIELELDTMQFFSRLPASFSFASTDPEQHPRLRSLRYEQRVLQNESRALRTGIMPELRLLGSFWGRGSGIGQKSDEAGNLLVSSSLSGLGLKAFNYAAGATLIWHPTRIFQIRNQVRAQNSRVEAKYQEYQASLQQTRSVLKNSDLQFNLAYQSVQQTPVQLKAARQAYAQSRARYENGLENIMLLTQVSDLYIRAETEYLISISNVWRSLLIKAAAKGDFNVFLEQIPD